MGQRPWSCLIANLFAQNRIFGAYSIHEYYIEFIFTCSAHFQYVFKVLCAMADYGLDPQAALDQPRFCLQGAGSPFPEIGVQQSCVVRSRSFYATHLQGNVPVAHEFPWSGRNICRLNVLEFLTGPISVLLAQSCTAEKRCRCGQCRWCGERRNCTIAPWRRLATRDAGGFREAFIWFCPYIYIYIYIYTYTYTYIHIYIYTYTHIHIYTYTHTNIHIYTYTHIHIYT